MDASVRNRPGGRVWTVEPGRVNASARRSSTALGLTGSNLRMRLEARRRIDTAKVDSRRESGVKPIVLSLTMPVKSINETRPKYPRNTARPGDGLFHVAVPG